MIYVLLLFILPFACLSIYGRRYYNPYRLYLVFGKKGSGKSTYLIKLALKYQKKGYTVYTNMDDCMVPDVRLIDINDLGDFVPQGNSLLLVDEVGMIWDNRDFKKFKASVRDFFKLQRHYHVICYLASQTFDIDKKLRDLCDGMILFVNVFNVISIGKPITRKVTLTESTSEAESRIAENLAFMPFWNWKISWIPKYSKYFNSFKIPDMPLLKYNAVTRSLLEDLSALRGPKWIKNRNMKKMFHSRYYDLILSSNHVEDILCNLPEDWEC